MKFWQQFAMVNMHELPALARKADECGFEGALFSDHLVTFSHQYDRYIGSNDEEIIWYPDTHWPDPFIEIGALAQITQRLKFITSVYVMPMRDPFSVAKAISTAAILSDYRLRVGVGIGWQRAEFNIVERPFEKRGPRTDEMLEVVRKLLTGKEVEHHGEFYDFDALSMAPGVTGHIPVFIGGLSEAAFARAARNDGWLGYQHTIEEVERIVPALRRARQASGRDPDEPFEITLSLKNPAPQDYDRARELGVTGVYKDAWLDPEGRASVLPLEEKLADLEWFSDRFIR